MTHDEIIKKWMKSKFIGKSNHGILVNTHYSDTLNLCCIAATAEREACVNVLRIKAGQAMDAAMKAKAAGDDATAMDIRHATWMDAVDALNGGDE